MRRILLLTPVILIASAAFSAPRDKPHVPEVSIQDRRFTPPEITIKAGESVLWTNRDQLDHSVDARDGAFSSGTIKSGKTYEHTFKKAGRYAYECKYHPRMKGAVIVK